MQTPQIKAYQHKETMVAQHLVLRLLVLVEAEKAVLVVTQVHQPLAVMVVLEKMYPHSSVVVPPFVALVAVVEALAEQQVREAHLESAALVQVLETAQMRQRQTRQVAVVEVLEIPITPAAVTEVQALCM
jgi:hypothetical protein